jgi:hypothetical protein
MGWREITVGLGILGLLFGTPIPGGAESPDLPETIIDIYPVTSGFSRPAATPLSRVLIVSTASSRSLKAAMSVATDIFQRGGIKVLAQDSVRPFVETQGPQLRERQDFDAQYRAMAKKAGADHVVILDVTDTLVPEKQSERRGGYLHDERVSVRGVGVESGFVVFEGVASWSQPVEQAGEHIRELTAYAIGRAICPIEKWEEASTTNRGRGRCR